MYDIFDLLHLEFHAVFYNDHALLPRDRFRQRVQQRGLAGRRAAAHKKIVAAADQDPQQLCPFRRNGPVPFQIREMQKPLGKLSDRQSRTVDRDVPINAVDAGSIRESGIHDRMHFIDLTMHLPGNAAEDLFQLCRRIKGPRIAFDLSAALHKNMFRSVDHDLRNRRVMQQRIENTERSAGLQKKLLYGFLHFTIRKHRGLRIVENMQDNAFHSSAVIQFFFLCEQHADLIQLPFQKSGQVLFHSPASLLSFISFTCSFFHSMCEKKAALQPFFADRGQRSHSARSPQTLCRCLRFAAQSSADRWSI